jgi:hypothetical protein
MCLWFIKSHTDFTTNAKIELKEYRENVFLNILNPFLSQMLNKLTNVKLSDAVELEWHGYDVFTFLFHLCLQIEFD